jgi:hypothetical protein
LRSSCLGHAARSWTVPIALTPGELDIHSRTVENPVTRALREGLVVGLANHTLLIAKDGTERPIDDSAAPIRDVHGDVLGVVLVFRDVTERRRLEATIIERARQLEEADRRLPGVVSASQVSTSSSSRGDSSAIEDARIAAAWAAAALGCCGDCAPQ